MAARAASRRAWAAIKASGDFAAGIKVLRRAIKAAIVVVVAVAAAVFVVIVVMGLILRGLVSFVGSNMPTDGLNVLYPSLKRS